MKRVGKINVLAICLLLAVFIFGIGTASADSSCLVVPKSLTMDFDSVPTTGTPIRFAVDAVSSCATTMYYYFSYAPNYGTSDYDATNWVNMRDVTFSTDNSVTHTFTEPGGYVVVVWTSATASAPNPLTLIGTTVIVQEGSGSSNCTFQASALTVNVTNALTGHPIEGATVTGGGQTDTTNSSGAATLAHVPTSQEVTIQVSASGYVTQSMQVNVACGETQQQGVALLPSDDAGVASGNIRIILTWGQNPSDLDTHLTGPKTSGSDRFHIAYYAKNNCSAAPCDASIPAWLDVDDTTSFGPETVSIEKSGGSFVAGTYRYYVHHYSGSSNIPASGAQVKIYEGSTLIRSFTPPTTSQSVGDNWVWSVFTMDVSASGQVSIHPVGTYSGPYGASDTTIFQGEGGSSVLPEVYSIFDDQPEK